MTPGRHGDSRRSDADDGFVLTHQRTARTTIVANRAPRAPTSYDPRSPESEHEVEGESGREAVRTPDGVRIPDPVRKPNGRTRPSPSTIEPERLARASLRARRMIADRILQLSLALALYLAVFFWVLSAQARPGTKTPTAAIDLNRASAAQLTRLPGIGPKRAEEIVALRTRRPFRHPRELLRMKGIGPKTFRRIEPWVIARPLTTPAPRAPAPLGSGVPRGPAGPSSRGTPPRTPPAAPADSGPDECDPPRGGG